MFDPPPDASGWHREPVVVHLGHGERVTVAGSGEHTIEHEGRRIHLRIDGDPPTLSAERLGARRVQVTTDDELSGTARIQVRAGRGRWRTRPLERALFDGTRAALDGWRQSGLGRFVRTEDGALRTEGGLGLLWYARRQFTNAAFRLQWRDARPDGQRSNGGVFVRFPDWTPGNALSPCDTWLFPALADHSWHAVACGHEIQINDGDVDPQRTGSVYGFAPLDAESAQPAPAGSWNDYEVRTTGGGDYAVTVVRNRHVINRFVNASGQSPVTGPPSSLYPPTDVKQFAAGYLGLQNHGPDDTIEYRDVRVLELGRRTRSLRLPRAWRHRVVKVRAVDAAGNRSRALRLAP